MDEEDDRIPAVAWHRGCPIQDQQSLARIQHVRDEIDRIHGLSLDDAEELVGYCENWFNPPESRMYAAARLEALWQLASEERRPRPRIDLLRVKALVAGLGSRRWRNPWTYGSLFDLHGVPREKPLPE